MAKSIADKFLEKKVKNIMQFNRVLLKNVYKRNVENSKIFEECIYEYINNFGISNSNIDKVEKENEKFFIENKVNLESQKRLFVIMLTIVTKKVKPIADIQFIDNLALFSEAVAISIDLEECTMAFREKDIGYKKAIAKINKKYKPFSNKDIAKKIKISNVDLKKCFMNSYKFNKKILDIENDNPFYLEFYKITDKEGPPFDSLEIELKDSSKELQNFNSNKIEEIMIKKNILYEHVPIYLEMVSLKILQILFSNKKYNMFVVKIPKDYLKTKKNIKEIIGISDNIKLKNKICLKIDRSEFEKYYDSILEIKNSGFNIAVYNIKTIGEITDNIKKTIDCISTTSKKETQLVKEVMENIDYTLFERDVGTGDVILEL